MEEKRDYAKECGIRCRQIRMSKGMSQQALADLVNVTAQAISKWEKEGISNIDHIMKLSSALGQDITADQFDQDGALTEVGKEILRIIIDNRGYADFSDIESNMFGMKSDRIGNELFKLERIGAVVREQFKDFTHSERDGVFITAKGVIVYKNSIFFSNFISSETLSNVETIDAILGNLYSSFQDRIDQDKVTEILANLEPIETSYRCDYIMHLINTCYEPVIRHNNLFVSFMKKHSNSFCGESCYIDILKRMAQSASRKELDRYIEWFDEPSEFELEMKAAVVDEEDSRAVHFFINTVESMSYLQEICYGEEVYYGEEVWDYDSNNPEVQDAIKKLQREQEEDIFYRVNSGYKKNENEFFEELSGPDELLYPMNWFNEEKIRDFIEKNIRPAETEYEKKINQSLKQIWSENEQTLKYYYSFPKRWEENGLAQMIRERVGVPDMSMHDEAPLE